MFGWVYRPLDAACKHVCDANSVKYDHIACRKLAVADLGYTGGIYLGDV